MLDIYLNANAIIIFPVRKNHYYTFAWARVPQIPNHEIQITLTSESELYSGDYLLFFTKKNVSHEEEFLIRILLY